jgi:hypothetical protein
MVCAAVRQSAVLAERPAFEPELVPLVPAPEPASLVPARVPAPEVCAPADDSAIDSTIGDTDIFTMEVGCQDMERLALSKSHIRSSYSFNNRPPKTGVHFP